MRSQKSWCMGVGAAAQNLIVAGTIGLADEADGCANRRKCFIEPDTLHQ
jgi:hypothetical protein